MYEAIDIETNALSKQVIGIAMKVHTALGPGLLESAYEHVLCYELAQEGLAFERQKALPLVYEDVKLEAGYRVDILVEKKLILEIKSVETINEVHLAQVLTYLKLSGVRLGILMNFNVARLKEGIKRIAN